MTLRLILLFGLVKQIRQHFGCEGRCGVLSLLEHRVRPNPRIHLTLE
jgi:hypothetical protein